MNTLQIKNLSKTYSNKVVSLNNVSLEIPNGMFGLLGPNGAGKSTLMKTIAGLQKADSGKVLFNGVDIALNPQYIKKQLGYLPQHFGVYPKIPAFQLLEHIAILKGLTNKKERHEQIHSLLAKVNLYAQRNTDVHSFSGGMKQRFGIAQTLLGNPQIIIVDEPTAGLDPEERNRFNNLLSEISEQIIIILSTHIVEDVRNLCTQMAIINRGNLLVCGSPEDFINELKGSVWSKKIERHEKNFYEENFCLISSQLHAGKLLIHIHAAEQPAPGFTQKEPDLEDVYFSHLLNLKQHA